MKPVLVDSAGDHLYSYRNKVITKEFRIQKVSKLGWGKE